VVKAARPARVLGLSHALIWKRFIQGQSIANNGWALFFTALVWRFPCRRVWDTYWEALITSRCHVRTIKLDGEPWFMPTEVRIYSPVAKRSGLKDSICNASIADMFMYTQADKEQCNARCDEPLLLIQMQYPPSALSTLSDPDERIARTWARRPPSSRQE
jgi:hypothetical protein